MKGSALAPQCNQSARLPPSPDTNHSCLYFHMRTPRAKRSNNVAGLCLETQELAMMSQRSNFRSSLAAAVTILVAFSEQSPVAFAAVDPGSVDNSCPAVLVGEYLRQEYSELYLGPWCVGFEC